MDKSSHKPPNYSVEQEQILRDAAPVNWEAANLFADQFGKSVKSVIAKVQSLDLQYIPKAKPAKKEVEPTKAEMVANIEAETGLTLTGLEKAPVNTIKTLLAYAIGDF